MGEIEAELRRVRRYQAQIDRRLAVMEIKGRATDVDNEKRKCRIRIGTTADGRPVLSPWVSWAEPRSGSFAADHTPMKVGDPLTLRSPGGVLGASSVAHRDGYSGDHPAPSTAGDAVVERTGSVTITRRADGLEIGVGGTTFAFSAGGLKQTGGSIEHDGHLIDKNHHHTGVKRGDDETGPVA